MRTKVIHPFYSIVLTLLAAAACGYLNKERLTLRNPIRMKETKELKLETNSGMPTTDYYVNADKNK